MANILNKRNSNTSTKRATLENTYNKSLGQLLLIIFLSVVNIILLVWDSNTYFLFSAFIPFFLVDCGMYFTGSYPAEYYYDMEGVAFFDKSVLIATFVIAAVILLIYFLCWIFAKKKKVGWLIAATVLFGIDTLAMLAIQGFSVDISLSILFHILVICWFVYGIATYYKMKKLPEEELTENAEVPETQPTESTMLRWADMDVKARILLRADAQGYQIVYRRVKRTNELVINGKVYDEFVALLEGPHTLSAVVNGHTIEVQYDTSSHMLIVFDGTVLAKKLRII